MTVITTNATDGPFTGNGVTTVFPFTFSVAEASEVDVYVDGAIETAGITVAVNVNGNGGNVTFDAAPAIGVEIVLASNPSFSQGTSFENAGAFLASTHDAALDKLTRQNIYIRGLLERTVLAPIGEVMGTIANAAARVGKYLSFDAEGSPVISSGTGADAGLRTDLAASDGSVLVGFLQSGTGAVSRSVRSKLRELNPSPKDFGAVGDGVTNDADALNAAIAGRLRITFASGNYLNSSRSLSLPFGKVMVFGTDSDIVNSGVGTTTYSGVTIRENYNPGNLTGWTGVAAYSYEGLSVDFGGYGPRAFGPAGTPSALNGSMKIPATSTIANHASGVSAYVKSSSITTGGVGLYAEANREAASALVWGANTVTYDHGFGGANVWGYECDLNIDNVGTTAVGIDVVGASSVEPTLSIAYQVQAIGVFSTPKKRWQYGFLSKDAAAIIGIQLGAQGETANSASQIFKMNFRNAANAVIQGFSLQVDGDGNAVMIGGTGASLFTLRTPTSTVDSLLIRGDQIGFFGTLPVGKPAVTGSRGGNAALASLLTQLASMGLITDSSTA